MEPSAFDPNTMEAGMLLSSEMQEAYNKCLSFMLDLFRRHGDTRAYEELMYGQDRQVAPVPRGGFVKPSQLNKDTPLLLDFTGEVQLSLQKKSVIKHGGALNASLDE